MTVKKLNIFVFVVLSGISTSAQDSRNLHYITNQEPLQSQPYTVLPLGDIKPQGWLKTMLEIQQKGLTGNLDEVYEKVMGSNNGWLGGTGDSWERGPYWLDGLTPLAYLLDDSELQAKVKKWVDWSIENQRESGYFGPHPFKKGTQLIAGTQQKNSEDWWPKMVMLKVLQQYYSATQDERVLTLMDRYFRYQLKELPDKPLGHWTFWGQRRGGDNLQLVYWLYNITGDKYLLELGDLIHEQTFDWTGVYSGDTLIQQNPHAPLHCVNVAQGFKEPVIYYQKSKDSTNLLAPYKGLQSLRAGHGWANGMYGGDEALHGNDPTQGSELCSAVELMFSLESILPVTGNMYYADHLEKIAYNVLPTQIDDDFQSKQYFQQANQIKITHEKRNFDNGYGGSGTLFGILTGYPCCVSNMHQGWPKFVQSLFHATSSNGIAALVYAPSSATVKVADGTNVEIEEITNYPFEETIKFKINPAEPVDFTFELRVPGWCDNPQVSINGKIMDVQQDNSVLKINRTWNLGDEMILELPMEIKKSRWFEYSVAIERGPLLYALKIQDKWVKKNHKDFENPFYEVFPKSPWNYGIPLQTLDENKFKVVFNKTEGEMPWNLENAPISIFTSGKRIPHWKEYNGNTGKLPLATATKPFEKLKTSEDQIELIPYGCTTLRISQFPVVEVFYKKLKE